MLFLYRFDILQIDAAFGDFSTQDAFTSQQNYENTVFTYTNHERPISVEDAQVLPALAPAYVQVMPFARAFEPIVISHDGLVLDGLEDSGTLKVVVPKDNPIAQMFAFDYPESRILLTIYSLNDATATPKPIWSGYVSSAEAFSTTADLSAFPLSEALERSIATGKFTRGCRRQLYDYRTCGVNPMAPDSATFTYWAFREDGYALSYDPVSGALTVPQAANRPDGFFTGGVVLIEPFYPIQAGNGYVQGFQPRGETNWTRLGNNTERRYLPYGGFKRSIQGHVGGVLTLSTPLTKAIAAGAKVSVFAGCDRLRPTCRDKFGNARRYGGHTFIPIKNLYETGIK